jgi:hypothetical protein
VKRSEPQVTSTFENESPRSGRQREHLYRMNVKSRNECNPLSPVSRAWRFRPTFTWGLRPEIHRGITTAVACLADITTDNPNVWFELGVAIASQRLVVIVCSKERTVSFPFDVQHLSIIRYATDSSSDFDKLKKDIAVRWMVICKSGQTPIEN